MKWIKENDEVLYSVKPRKLFSLSKDDTEYLQSVAQSNVRNRSRICAHATVKDDIHEMIIYHPKGTYVHPHKHIGKDESFHLICGEIDLVIFDEDGTVVKVLRMEDYISGRTFYYRVFSDTFHTQIFRKNTIFHEVTRGPFNKSDTVVARWAPDGKETDLVEDYTTQIIQHINSFKS